MPDDLAIPPGALKVMNVLRAAGHTAVLAGGSVRDVVLGRAPRDWDVATSAPGEQVQSLFPRVNPVGLRHNTVGVFEEESWIEVTTFRDRQRTLEGDLALRDFTVNAMALDPETGRIIDPLGGRADLGAGVLRACGSALDRFTDDPLRILRAARFLAELGLEPDADVTQAAAALAARLESIAPERIRDEWLKLLVGPETRRAFAWLERTGVTAVILPPLAVTVGVAQNRWHRFDVYGHTVETVARADADVEVRLAGLFHDLGKPAVRQWRNNDYTFYNHERISAEIASATLTAWRLPQRLRDRVVSLVANHMFHYDPAWTDAAVRRFLRRVSPELLDPQFRLRLADSAAAGLGGEAEAAQNLAELRGRIEREMAARRALRITDLPVDGHDVMRVTGATGPRIGVVLRMLLERVTDDPALNDRDRLLRELETLAE